MRLAALALLLAACGNEDVQIGPRIRSADCVSPCGARLYGSTDCEGFAFAEARALGAFGENAPGLCRKLDGWRFTRLSDIAPLGVWDRTWCDTFGVQLASDNWRYGYAHSLGHVLQCPNFIDYGHETWTWQWQAIDEANR